MHSTWSRFGPCGGLVVAAAIAVMLGVGWTAGPCDAAGPKEVPRTVASAQCVLAGGDVGFKPGAGGMVLSTLDGRRELYVTGSSQTYGLPSFWSVLHYDGEGAYRQVWVSEDVAPDYISGLEVGDVTGDGAAEIVEVLSRGTIRVYDQRSRRLIRQFDADFTGFGGAVWGTALHDLDGDGKSEILLTTYMPDPSLGGLSVSAGDGTPLWNLPGDGGAGVAVGQVDDDPSLEIVTADGVVVDVATRTVQWRPGATTGGEVALADRDGDGVDEIILSDYWLGVTCLDARTESQLWALEGSDYREIVSLQVANIDCDAAPELLIGVRYRSPNVTAVDTVTLARDWESPYGMIGTLTAMVVGDPDGDGQQEVVWGAEGKGLGVLGVESELEEWRSAEIVGPFSGPETADLAGDGAHQLVALARATSSLDGDRIVVFDSATLAVEKVAWPTYGGSLYAFDVVQADAGPADEIVTVGWSTYQGGSTLEIYALDPVSGGLEQVWTPEPAAHPIYRTVTVADVDQDGQPEVVTGTDKCQVATIDIATGLEEWRSTLLADIPNRLTRLEVLTAGGGRPDLLALAGGGALYVFDCVDRVQAQKIPGAFTSLEVDEGAATRRFRAGAADGTLTVFEKTGDVYIATSTATVSSDPVTASLTRGDGSQLIGSGGRVRFHPAPDQPASWESARYGESFGSDLAMAPVIGGGVVSGGQHGLYVVAPETELAALAPSSADPSGGTMVTLDGSGFDVGSQVFFDDQPSPSMLVMSSEQVVAELPPLAPGATHDVTVVNGDLARVNGRQALMTHFLDVGGGAPIQPWVERMLRRRVTAGCGGGAYCPDQLVTRAQMAVFLLRAHDGERAAPIRGSGARFVDVPCGGFAVDWIEEIARRRITVGCGGDRFCPDAPVSRAQVAVLLLKTVEGPDWTPPAATGLFDDVPAESPFAPWIEELARRGVTAGCGPSLYCPESPASRGQIAVLVGKAFGW